MLDATRLKRMIVVLHFTRSTQTRRTRLSIALVVKTSTYGKPALHYSLMCWLTVCSSCEMVIADTWNQCCCCCCCCCCWHNISGPLMYFWWQDADQRVKFDLLEASWCLCNLVSSISSISFKCDLFITSYFYPISSVYNISAVMIV